MHHSLFETVDFFVKPFHKWQKLIHNDVEDAVRDMSGSLIEQGRLGSDVIDGVFECVEGVTVVGDQPSFPEKEIKICGLNFTVIGRMCVGETMNDEIEIVLFLWLDGGLDCGCLFIDELSLLLLALFPLCLFTLFFFFFLGTA